MTSDENNGKIKEQNLREIVKDVELVQLDKYENMIKFRDFVNAECEKMGHKEDAQMCREFYSVIQRECNIIRRRWVQDEDEDDDQVDEHEVDEDEN
jgi:DNA transposition AAA+ family ATPase